MNNRDQGWRTGWTSQPPTDPGLRRRTYGPIQPMEGKRTLLQRLFRVR